MGLLQHAQSTSRMGLSSAQSSFGAARSVHPFANLTLDKVLGVGFSKGDNHCNAYLPASSHP